MRFDAHVHATRTTLKAEALTSNRARIWGVLQEGEGRGGEGRGQGGGIGRLELKLSEVNKRHS